MYNFNKLLKIGFAVKPACLQESFRGHKLLSLRPPLPAIPTGNTFTLKILVKLKVFYSKLDLLLYFCKKFCSLQIARQFSRTDTNT